MTESDCYNSKLSENIYFEKDIYLHFRNLQENQNPKAIFWKDCTFSLKVDSMFLWVVIFHPSETVSLTKFSNVWKIPFCILAFFLE